VSGSFDNLTYNTGYQLRFYCYGSGYNNSAVGTYNKTTANLTAPSAPTNISFTQYAIGDSNVNASWTKGANTTHTDIDMSTDNSTWNSVNSGLWWFRNINDSYKLDTGYFGQHYFRLRPHNFDGYNDVVGSWTTGYGVVFVQGNTYYWNGSSWVLGEVYYWSGSQWVKVTETLKTWNGSSWV
jgi:hypothetical protein